MNNSYLTIPTIVEVHKMHLFLSRSEILLVNIINQIREMFKLLQQRNRQRNKTSFGKRVKMYITLVKVNIFEVASKLTNTSLSPRLQIYISPETKQGLKDEIKEVKKRIMPSNVDSQHFSLRWHSRRLIWRPSYRGP